MSDSHVKRTQVQEKLLDDSGFAISREELMEFFVTENMHKKDFEGGTSKSLHLLQKNGFAENILRKLSSNEQRGLEQDPADLRQRRKLYGSNKRH